MGDQQHVFATGLDVILGHREAEGASGAAPLGDGQASGGAGKAHLGNEVGAQRRDHEAGARRRDDEVDVLGLQAGVVEGLLGGALAELLGGLDEQVIAMAEAMGRHGVLDGLHQIAAFDATVADDLLHAAQMAVPLAQHDLGGALQGLTGELMGRKNESGFERNGRVQDGLRKIGAST